MNLNEVQNLFDLQPAGRLSVEQAFEFYRTSYSQRLTKALRDKFEAVNWVLGPENFTDLCTQFIEDNPSSSYSLENYGNELPQFLVTTEIGKQCPFLEDLATFEWALKEVADAPISRPLSPEQTQELLTNDDFKVSFVEGMRIFQSHYSLLEIWESRNRRNFSAKDFKWRTPESLLIFKKADQPFVVKLDPIEAEIILELKEGRSVSEALADFANLMSPQKTQKLFDLMITTGIIDDVRVWA